MYLQYLLLTDSKRLLTNQSRFLTLITWTPLYRFIQTQLAPSCV